MIATTNKEKYMNEGRKRVLAEGSKSVTEGEKGNDREGSELT